MKREPAESFWARVDAAPGEGTPEFRLVVSDITTEKNSEEALQLLDRLNSLESLAGGIAHDFNNLLGGIFGYVALARNLGQRDPAVLRYLDKAGSVLQRATGLTGQLLTFTKRNVPDRKVQSLGPLVTKMASFVLTGTNVQVDFQLEEDLWPTSVDENQIGQVIDNLVLNASQSMDQGGRVHISLKNAALGSALAHGLGPGYYCHLTVTDTGTGIRPEVVTRIFDPFFTTKEHGHGLGLATCHSIVHKHGGTLWVETDWGRGSAFHVLLPAIPGALCPEVPATSPHHRGSGSILVMDDEPFNREILSTQLQEMGYTVLEAQDGDEALRLADTASLQAAFLDLTVRGGRGGRDTVGLLLERHPGLMIVAVSGFSVDPIMTHPGNFSFTDSLRKPFVKDQVISLLEKHKGGRESFPSP